MIALYSDADATEIFEDMGEIKKGESKTLNGKIVTGFIQTEQNLKGKAVRKFTINSI